MQDQFLVTKGLVTLDTKENGIKPLNISVELASTGFMIFTDDTPCKKKNKTKTKQLDILSQIQRLQK